jgi:hypothetical protein
MNQIKQKLTAMLAGEQTSFREKDMALLLDSMRSVIDDPAALRALGLFALQAISTHIKTSVQTEKVVMVAMTARRSGGCDD